MVTGAVVATAMSKRSEREEDSVSLRAPPPATTFQRKDGSNES